MRQAKDLEGLRVQLRETAANAGYQSIYQLHAAMQKKRVAITYRELCRVAAGSTVGVHWETLLKLCRFLGCQISDLFFVNHKKRS